MKKYVFALFAVFLLAAVCTGAVSADSKVIAGSDDLIGAVIGVQLGTTGDEVVTVFEGVNGTKIDRYNKGADAVQALKVGKVDCVVIDEQPALNFISVNKDLKIIEGNFDAEEYALCLKKGNTELLTKINTALAELKNEGTLSEIILNYIGDEKGAHPYVKKDVARDNGKLVVATNAEFAPYEFRDANDAIVGIDMDIMQAVCDKLGMELKIEDMMFDSIIVAVSTGKADVGAAGMSVTEDRLKNVDFSDPYTTTKQVIIVKDTSASAAPTASPAPFIGILAGLGAAVLALRKL